MRSTALGPGLPLPHRGARRGAGRGRACSAATWCSPAAATRCSTPTRSAIWWRRCAERGLDAGRRPAAGRRRGAAGGGRDRRRPAGGGRLQSVDLGDEPELQPGVPGLAGRAATGLALQRAGRAVRGARWRRSGRSWWRAACRGTGSRRGREIWSLPRDGLPPPRQRLAAGARDRPPMPARSSRRLAGAAGLDAARGRGGRRGARARVLAVRESPPLGPMLRDMLRYSTNLTAEVVGLRASQARGLAPGGLAASAAAMTAWARARFGLTRRGAGQPFRAERRHAADAGRAGRAAAAGGAAGAAGAADGAADARRAAASRSTARGARWCRRPARSISSARWPAT